MRTLKVGLLGTSSEFFVTKTGGLDGLGGSYFGRKGFYPKDCSFYDVSNSSDPIENVIKNVVDFILNLPQPGILPQNVTTGPPYDHFNCYLISDKRAKVYNVTPKFQSSFAVFEWKVDLIIAIMIILFAFLTKISSNEPLAEALWKYSNIILNGNLELFTRKLRFKSFEFLLISIIVWIVTMKTIYLGIIRTGFITVEMEREIDTINDAIKKNLTIVPSYTGYCFKTLEEDIRYSRTNNGHILGLINMRKSDNRRGKLYLGKLFKTVIIGEDITVSNSKSLRCMASVKHTHGLHQSKRPVISRILDQYYHKNIPKQRQDSMRTWGYSSLELGLHKTWMIHAKRVIENALYKLLDPSCMEPNRESPTPPHLRISFLADFFLLFVSVNCVATIAFIVEISLLC